MKIAQQELSPRDIDSNIVAKFQIAGKKVKCTEEEKRVYGVDFKNDDSSVTTIVVFEYEFKDNKKKFYRPETIWRGGANLFFFHDFFTTKKAAIDYIKETVKNKKD